MNKFIRICLALIVLVLDCTLCLAYSDHRNRHVDSLERVLRTCPPHDKADMIRLYDGLANGYLEVDEKKSMRYADSGIALSLELKAYKSLVTFHRIKGMHHWGHARYAEAEKEFLLAQDCVEKMRLSGKYDEDDVDDAESSLYGSLGNLYNTLGEGAKALKYYYRALRTFEKHNWRESQVICYGNMAELYYCMGNFAQAELYFQKGDSISDLIQDFGPKSFCLRGLAKVCMHRGDYEQAWEYIDMVYRDVSSRPEEEGSSRVECMVIMADIALAQGDYVRAREIVDANVALCDSLETENASLLSQRAQLAINAGNWMEAEQWALEALGIDDESPDVANELYKQLSVIYGHLGMEDKVRYYLDKADSVQTVWSNYAYQTSLTEQQTLYETEKKDKKIHAMTRERFLFIGMIVLVVILLIVLSGVIVQTKRSHKRQKALLAAKVALETETRERQMLAQDLHDGLGGMLSLLKLKIANQEQDAAIRLVDESVMEMRRVAHHIMPEELQKHGLATSLSDFAISIPGAQFHYFGDEHRLPAEIELVLYRCAYELVNNAIKHAGAEHIDIQLMVEDSLVTLTISDNGKGMDVETANKGFGLQNIRSRIAQYEGQMEIITAPDNGTEINIALPI